MPLPRPKTATSTASTAGGKNRPVEPSQPTELSYENCPPAFASFLRVWAKNVPLIQDLAPEYQHDVARVICGLEPLCQPIDITTTGIAADLRGVAIEISQRRSFQDRYAAALQAALDAGGGPSGTSSSGTGAGLSPKRASFVPPPVYQPSPPPSPNPAPIPLRGGRTSLDASSAPPVPPRPSGEQRHRPQASGSSLSPYTHSRGSSASSTASLAPPSPTSPTLFPFDSPAIEFIRETLYASLADQIELVPSLRKQLKRDPPRAYFASVSFAILDVAMRSITPDGEVIGVLGKRLTLVECPQPLRPFMNELVAIGKEARDIEDQDTELAVRILSSSEVNPNTELPPPRLERVRRMLEFGIGVERDGSGDRDERRYSLTGRTVTFTNRINALALGLTRLKAFRDRQDYVFKVLEGLGQS